MRHLYKKIKNRYSWGERLLNDPVLVDAKEKSRLEVEKRPLRTDIINYIANNCGTDIRNLEGSVIRLVAYKATFNIPKITFDIAKEAFKEIVQLITAFQKNLQSYLPALDSEIKSIIQEKSQDRNHIENTLDTLLSLTYHGVADNLFIELVDYYKTVDAKGAEFYWEEYDGKDGED